MSLADLGTVRMFEKNGLVEVFCPRGDAVTRNLVKEMKGRFDGSRKSWVIDPVFARSSVDEVVAKLTAGILSSTPPAWQATVDKLAQLVCTTKKFDVAVGAAGIRLEMPRDHKHEYALKALTHLNIESYKHQWLVPASACDDQRVKQIIVDLLKEDEIALGKCLDYLDEFTLNGDLKLSPQEMAGIGIKPGAVICAEPIFIRTADPKIPVERNMKLYPLRVVSLESRGDGTYPTKLAFITNIAGEARRVLVPRLSKKESQRLRLDVPHLTGKWVRRRG